MLETQKWSVCFADINSCNDLRIWRAVVLYEHSHINSLHKITLGRSLTTRTPDWYRTTCEVTWRDATEPRDVIKSRVTSAHNAWEKDNTLPVRLSLRSSSRTGSVLLTSTTGGASVLLSGVVGCLVVDCAGVSGGTVVGFMGGSVSGGSGFVVCFGTGVGSRPMTC